MHPTGTTTNSLGAYFPDLAANMLGCFFMGLAAAASTLKIKDVSTAVAVLPHRSPWQTNSALHVGVRTGYCGSLTTFASWELAMVQLLVGGKAGSCLFSRQPAQVMSLTKACRQLANLTVSQVCSLA